MVVDGGSVPPKVDAAYAEEDEDAEEEDADEKPRENREGDRESPMRMTVPLEAAESGRGPSGDDERLSWRAERAKGEGFLRRPVRPPDGSSRVLLEEVGSMAGPAAVVAAAVRAQRSGAE